MSLWLAVLCLAPADTLALKEKASVGGRWIRATDLVDLDRTEAGALRQIADLYLGPAPEAGTSRIITQDEIRREMAGRGIDPAGFAWEGERVEVVAAPAPASSLRGDVGGALKRHLLSKEPGLRTDDLSVQVIELVPEPASDGSTVVQVRPGKGGYRATLSDGREVAVVARIRRMMETAVAARDLAPGRVLEKGDLERTRVELPEDERPPGPAALLGAVTRVRIPRGSRVTPEALEPRAILKRGDVVRAVSPGFEVDARALEDGALGQMIGLEFTSSHNRLRARVVTGGRVEVVEAGR